MIQTKVKEITLHEFLQLPETKPASEYIGGQVIQKPMPQGWLPDTSRWKVVRQGHSNQ